MRIVLAACFVSLAMPVSAQVVRVGDLNTTQIRALDRSKTVVLLTGGMLEEHGPYLPAGTDAILSSELALEVAQTIVAKKPGWTVLAFPQIPFGSAGSNEIGGQFSFPGTYTVRPSTLLGNCRGSGTRRSLRRWVRRTIRCPTRRGMRPRRTVSTSGNSGIVSSDGRRTGRCRPGHGWRPDGRRSRSRRSSPC